MEINEKHIIKGLECCTRGRKSNEGRPCLECPYNECNLVGGTSERQIKGTCQGWLMKDALALIKSQEKRIKELEVENVQFRHKQEKLIEERDVYKTWAYNKNSLINSMTDKIELGYEPYAARACAEAEMWQRIALREKELTEENAEVKANWQKLKESHESACEECRAEFKRLTEENERLRAIPEQMKERLQAFFGTYVLGYKIPLTDALKVVNKIAKEMLDGEK